MGRNILFVTTDQQRFDSIGCNGNEYCHTPNVNELARTGISFQRAYCQNTLCMPARSTILTGQYVRTHGVYANGVPLPEDAPSFAQYLKEKAGYKTALVGKAHFEPAYDLNRRWEENRRQQADDFGPWRGFDYAIHAQHINGFLPPSHYGRWVLRNYPEWYARQVPLLDSSPGGDTGAPETSNHPIPRHIYHTDWLADRAVKWLEQLDATDDWFLWLSFRDPHHPWAPPASELGRCNWRDLPLPAGHPGAEPQIRQILGKKPAHWLAYYEGAFVNAEGGAPNLKPMTLTHDNIREINAKIHVMNEIIDEGVGKVVAKLNQRGWGRDTDIFFTTDHGELQGDFGLLYKGPFQVDSLMRLPMIWRPAPSANVTPAVLDQPVEQVDLAPTFCAIAGIEPAPWMQGRKLPHSDDGTRERAFCEWDSKLPGYGMHLRSLYNDHFVVTAYEPSTIGKMTGIEEEFPEYAAMSTSIHYDGSEGELYDLNDDPFQWNNLWDDPRFRTRKSDLLADLYDHLPPERSPRLKAAAPG